MKRIFFLLFSFFLLILSTLYVKSLNFNIIVIQGNSMYPTLKTNEIYFLTKKDFNRENIVTFIPPKNWDTKDTILIKRILAKENDKIKVEDNFLYVNGIKKMKTLNVLDTGEIIVGENQFFLVGDNYPQSLDSLYYINKNEDFLVNEENLINSF